MAVKRPPYLLRLKVSNFRSLRAVEVRLAALNVLVGPNGAGKSNLLDVIAFLGDAIRDDLGPALDRRGGFERILFRGTKPGNAISVEVEAAVTKNSNTRTTDNYSLEFSLGKLRTKRNPRNPGLREPLRDRFYLRRSEAFMFKRTAGPGRRIEVKGSEITFNVGGKESTASLREGSLGLATLPKLSPEDGGEQVEALADLFASFRVFDVDVAAARRPATQRLSQRLDNDGTNLASFLAYMADAHPERFRALVRDARRFIPGLADLGFETIGGAGEGTVLNLLEEGLPGSTTLQEASYGSIRALALLALLYDPAPPRLTCIEEIDHGLHPHVLDRLVELLREASERTQFLIATHSPALVNRLRSSELIVCERDEEAASRIPAIEPEVVRRMEAELHGEIGLGELWFTGALGGCPE
ncbi:AAA family ATPase [Plantactinospora mayteni]|uniref:Chromosome segregation protein SMC n=1 Tax=Plantactinospora mayteni TaxID=566021 RepID=A0ABQ4EQR8_9ACTN|nr:AAA family ATPase [Plantactinospora mayteni]GIG96996.1 chromosome segregation protein SMC [Plantactinospora mayteni]